MVLSQSPAFQICAFWGHLQRKTECPGYGRKEEWSFLALLNSTPPMPWWGSVVSAENAELLEAGSAVNLTSVVGKDRLVPWTKTSCNCSCCCPGEGNPLHQDYQMAAASQVLQGQFFQVNGSYLNWESLPLVSLSPGEDGGKRRSEVGFNFPLFFFKLAHWDNFRAEWTWL